MQHPKLQGACIRAREGPVRYKQKYAKVDLRLQEKRVFKIPIGVSLYQKWTDISFTFNFLYLTCVIIHSPNTSNLNLLSNSRSRSLFLLTQATQWNTWFSTFMATSPQLSSQWLWDGSEGERSLVILYWCNINLCFYSLSEFHNGSRQWWCWWSHRCPGCCR